MYGCIVESYEEFVVIYALKRTRGILELSKSNLCLIVTKSYQLEPR